jgi:hypothetical protein
MRVNEDQRVNEGQEGSKQGQKESKRSAGQSFGSVSGVKEGQGGRGGHVIRGSRRGSKTGVQDGQGVTCGDSIGAPKAAGVQERAGGGAPRDTGGGLG